MEDLSNFQSLRLDHYEKQSKPTQKLLTVDLPRIPGQVLRTCLYYAAQILLSDHILEKVLVIHSRPKPHR